jgi:O-antigen ligase
MSDARSESPRVTRWRGVAPHALVLLIAVASGVLIHAAVGFAVAIVGLLMVARPFDPVIAAVAVAAAASFVNNEGGQLTRDLAIVTLLAAYALLCFVAWTLVGRWMLPGNRLVIATLALFGLILVGALRGVIAGHSLRYLGLELLPLLSFGLAVAIGGLQVTRRQMTWAVVIACVAALGHVTLAMASYAVNEIRTGGLSFTPFPALVALLTLNLLLREERRWARLLLLLLTGLFLMHQVVSFTRGYWLGLLVAVPYSCFVYAGLRDRTRWKRIAGAFATIASVVVGSTILVGVTFGWSDLPALFLTRFASSVGTGQSSETASNVARLIEYWSAFQHIGRSPWWGYGLGFTMHTREAIFGTVTSQWFVHQNYLYIWLKLGIFGLAAFVLTLWAGFSNGTRLARERNASPADAAWGAAAAAATIHMAVVALTNFNLAQVNGTVLLAFLWGVSLARANPGRMRLVWRRPLPAATTSSAAVGT